MHQKTIRWQTQADGVPGRGECLPGGAFVCYVPGADGNTVETDDGFLPMLPVDQPMVFPRIARDGVRVAAAGHADNAAYLLLAGAWHKVGGTCGTNPVIFDAADSLVVVRYCAPPTGAQGWSYVAPAGNLVSIDAAYFDPSTGLHNFTDLGDCWIGQGGKAIGQGAVLMFKDDRVLRRLTFGDLRPTGILRDIRGRADGALKAITVVDYDEQLTTFTWATSAELRAMLPVAAVTQPPVIVTPDPVIPPEPEPLPMPDLPDYSVFVREFLGPRLKRIEGDEALTRAHSFEALNACADALHKQDRRVGLLRKTGGAQVKDRAADVIAIDKGDGTCQLFDAISDAEGHDGLPAPDWRAIDAHEAGIRPMDQWRAPFPVSAAPPVPTVPPVVVPPVVVPPVACQCVSRFAEIDARLVALDSKHAEQLAALERDVRAIADRPMPVPTLPRLRARGRARLSWSGVDIDIPVERA